MQTCTHTAQSRRNTTLLQTIIIPIRNQHFAKLVNSALRTQMHTYDNWANEHGLYLFNPNHNIHLPLNPVGQRSGTNYDNNYWGERSESLPSAQRRDFVCMYVCPHTSSTGTARYFGFASHDPYPFNFADELGVSNFAELAPHNALSIPLV